MSKDLSNAHVAKSNVLIGAAYRLTLQEQRIILAAISQVRRDQAVTDEVMYNVSVNALADITGQAAKHAYEELKEAALRLKKRDVRIEYEPNGNGRKPKVMITGWVQTITYIDDEGRIELRFSKDMLPYISQLSGEFTLYKLKNVAKMTSTYGIRLYEILMQWQGEGEREITIEWLKNTLEIADDYPRLYDFKRWVLEPAVKQINEHSDLWCEWGQRKTGRQVTHIQFKFGTKSSPKETKSRKELPSLSPKISGISKREIEQKARPGESYEQAATRISKQKSAKSKPKKEEQIDWVGTTTR